MRSFKPFAIVAVFVSACVAADIDTVRERRYAEIVGATTGATSIPSWLSSLGLDGKWPDSEVDYTTGCDAREASWPAETHWRRINTFAAAWHGGFKNALQFAGSPTLRANISLAMQFWFSNDFKEPSCIDSGGTESCPCGTPGFWNQNWFSNIIGIPQLVAQVCLLLGDSLTTSELSNCTKITGRAFNTFKTGINGVSAITGANALDIAFVGVDLGLFTSDVATLSDAYERVHNEITIQNAIKADGIRADGSFGQHKGILYNGNYGKDYLADVLLLDTIAGGTQFQANSSAQNALTTLLDGDQWMVFKNLETGVVHWDYSVIGRVISLPVADGQASANLKLNLTQIKELGELWDSANVTQVFNRLSATSSTVNQGSLLGNRMFFANDYMVHRGNNYVTTLKMYSKRTQNSECVNVQNTMGFHLSDGTLYTYTTGNEYEDIFAAWDWNLIPGTTIDYDATPLNCSGTRKTGTQSFVGGASNGSVGVAAMRYETPTSKTLNWRKTWFFLPNDVQFVMVARITSNTSAPVFSVLDQRRHSGDVFVSGEAATSGNFTGATSLWHGGVGYTFNVSDPVTLSFQIGQRTGDWSVIGTSDEPPPTVDLFAAWLAHDILTASASYVIYPGTSSFTEFDTKAKASRLQSVRNDGSISALLDAEHNLVMVVYWVTAGGSVTIPSPTGDAPLKIQSTANSALILDMNSWSLTASDPSQTVSNITLTFTLGSGSLPAGWAGDKTKMLEIALPSGGNAGASVTRILP